MPDEPTEKEIRDYIKDYRDTFCKLRETLELELLASSLGDCPLDIRNHYEHWSKKGVLDETTDRDLRRCYAMASAASEAITNAIEALSDEGDEEDEED